jgi:hypothetical protein
MVFRLPPQSEIQLQREFTALISDASSYLGSIDDCDEFSIWTCGVNREPDARGYWIGKLSSYYGYLVVRPFSLNGTETLEAIRGWVDPGLRSKGLFSTLLRQASRSGTPLVSDREGMTDVAHAVWQSVSHFERRYFDTMQNVFVLPRDVPEDERFSACASARRWLLVLHPVQSAHSAGG